MPTIAVDFDGTISRYEGWKGLGTFGPPIKGCREELQKLRAAGWTIILFTTRGLDIREVQKYMFDNNIPYDLVNCNTLDAPLNVSDKKVLANVYLDDRAITFDGEWEGMAEKVKNFTPHYLRRNSAPTHLKNGTLASAQRIMVQDLQRLEEANRERSDAWRNVGLGGLFLDLRKQYLRCRSFIWERLLNRDPMVCDPDDAAHERWRIKSIDILRDLRNYALFLQILLEEKKYSNADDSDHWSEIIAKRLLDQRQLEDLITKGYQAKMSAHLPEDL
jgi:hypothetical protein